jgi:hypothetical protein
MNTNAAQLVLEVTEVDLAILESNPPQLQIAAKGNVSTPGWSNPKLVPYVYIQAPPDGIYDFDFVAIPPSNIVPQVITPISVTLVQLAEGARGVRIHASTNSKEALLMVEESFCL